jgi:hypothetical protein
MQAINVIVAFSMDYLFALMNSKAFFLMTSW